MTTSIKTIAMAISVGLYGTFAYAQPIDANKTGTMYFFENGIPETIVASNDSKLKIGKIATRDGKSSLVWTFKKGSELTLTQDVGFKPFVANEKDQSISTFTTWIYNEKALDGKMRFNFNKKGETQAHFDINMDFTGWRNLLVPYRDMEGTPTNGMDQIVIDTSGLKSGGTIHIDQMMTSIPADPRWPTRDAVVPYINMDADTAPNRHWLSLQRYDEFLDKSTMTLNEIRVDNEKVEKIKAKLHDFASSGKAKNTDAQLDKLKKTYESYGLKEYKGEIIGKPLDNTNRQKMFLDKGVNRGLLNQEEFDLLFGAKDLREYGDFMLELANALQGDLKAKDRKELEKMYIDLTRYGLNQGYEAGSGVGTVHHFGYTLRNLFEAHYLTRDVLTENNMIKEVADMMAWFSAAGRIYAPKEELASFNVDIMNTQLRGMLYSVIMQPNETTRNAWLQQFSNWISGSLTETEGLNGGIKYDGSIFHHVQHYPAYGRGALKGLTPVIEALSGTDFAVTKEAHEAVKKAVVMTELYSNDRYTLMSVVGRHPTGDALIGTTPFKHMALAGTPDGKKAIDPDMASAYLRLTQGEKNDDFRTFLLKKGFKAGSVAEGNFTMNLASLNIQRRDDWVAAARGYSRYLVGNESYANANRYGRYINYGHVEIMDADGKTRAFSHDGFNWNRWSGTTAVQVPLQDLNAQLRNVDRFSGLEEMLFNEQTYAGGVGNGKNGMYAMTLQAHPKYDATFLANKSVFFFDNRIVALGSGINTMVSEYPTQTTLFQHALRVPSDAMYVNGLRFNKGEEKSVESKRKYTQLIDPDGNAYFVSSDSDVKVSAINQKSFNQKNSKPTEGKFATAVIDHGKAPKDASYEYSVLINPTVKQQMTFASSLGAKKGSPYTVIQKDDNAHIVYDRASKTTGYAVFAPDTNIENSVIVKVEEPAMILAESKKDRLHLSLVNPDLNLYQGKDESMYKDGIQQEVSIYSRSWKSNEFQPVKNKLVLNGVYKNATKKLPKGVELKVNGLMTEVQFTTVGADPIQLKLKKS
ncbi:chondroitin sulfate ABC exolyase [Vibrio alfacsensis]|uniref:chondroitinase family polysaccharide lyase n=1 Tax=Vibrio alfacsensis TaxID=1074311 RepID=UPI001BED44A3|nr:chondroitinase family polysaccharide lyase [Vibrio alfacsensis]BBM67506.1 chondroitin sulfate ABC exolyase [Vibrio alfacsensis]